MKFQPKSDNEITSANLWPAGSYDFEVSEAEEAQSKAGNDMVKLTVFVFNEVGERRTVFDYLVDTEGGAYKIKHFAEATGMLDAYESGQLEAHNMIGRTGRCKLAIQKDKSGQFPDKNGIADYLKPALQAATAATRVKAPAGRDLNDEVPF